MKDSHFKTPRTLDECTFYSWGNTVFRDDANETQKDPDRLVLIGCTLCLVFVFGYLLVERFL